MTDKELLDGLRTTLADVRLGTPVESVLARGRVLRRRRRLLPAAAAGAACLAGVAGLGVAGGLPGTAGQVRLAAFTVTKQPHHMVDLAVRKHGQIDPRRLVYALRSAGVPVAGSRSACQADRLPISAILTSPRAGKDDLAVYRIHVSEIPRGSYIQVVVPSRGATRAAPRAAGHPRPAPRRDMIVISRWAGGSGPSLHHDPLELELVTPGPC